MKNNLNLFEIHKKNLFENPELNNVTSGFFENNHCNNTNEFKKTVNQSSQSDFYFDEADPDTRIMKEHYSKIDDILKQKMMVNKKRPKLKKIRFKFDKEKDNYMNNFGKSNFHDIFMKKYNTNLKPLQHYLKCSNKENFKNNITSKTIKEKTRNHSLILTKKNSKDEKNIYEVYHSLNNNNISNKNSNNSHVYSSINVIKNMNNNSINNNLSNNNFIYSNILDHENKTNKNLYVMNLKNIYNVSRNKNNILINNNPLTQTESHHSKIQNNYNIIHIQKNNYNINKIKEAKVVIDKMNYKGGIEDSAYVLNSNINNNSRSQHINKSRRKKRKRRNR